MPAMQLKQALRQVRRLVGDDARSLPDAQLLAQYTETKDESAFAILTERHAAIVLGVCRRVLANNHDAEDACQATFLVLARKPGSIRKGNSLRCWLHGVAFRVASKLRKQRQRRSAVPLVEPPAKSVDLTWREVQRVLDEELLRLPEEFRLPLMLCYLDGKTRDEAADELGWSASTFRGRLERGRERLRRRLEAKGVGLTAGLLVAMLSLAADATSIPGPLGEALTQLSLAGPPSKLIGTLAEGAMSTVNTSAMKLSLVAIAVGFLIASGIGLLEDGAPASVVPLAAASEPAKEKDKEPPARPLSDDELKNTARKIRDAAIEWLKKNQSKDGTWENTNIGITWKGGSTALAVAALVDSGIKTNDPLLAKAVSYLRELKSEQTYTVALQTVALTRINDKKDAEVLKRNVEWLEAAAVMGPNAELNGWSYTRSPQGRADYSNTQFAILALDEAGRVGFKPKNKKFWDRVRELYLEIQLADSGWGYTANSVSSFSMTCAGLCGLYLADDNLGEENKASRAAKAKASVWLARRYAPFQGMSALYNLHLLARLGKLSGEKKVGDHDWYREGVEWILQQQKADGSVYFKGGIDGMKPIATSFAILFLNSQLEMKGGKP